MLELGTGKERTCQQCKHKVYHCETEEEVRTRTNEGQCVSMFVKSSILDVMESLIAEEMNGTLYQEDISEMCAALQDIPRKFYKRSWYSFNLFKK
jgi:hypothetical protein